MKIEIKKNIKSGRRFNICQNVNCHEKLLTEQEIRSGFCQKHGGLLSDSIFEEVAEDLIKQKVGDLK